MLGIALLHPNLSGQMGPTLSRLLARTKLGRSLLRPFLRTEVGEVANRRAWHNPERLTPEVCALGLTVKLCNAPLNLFRLFFLFTRKNYRLPAFDPLTSVCWGLG